MKEKDTSAGGFIRALSDAAVSLQLRDSDAARPLIAHAMAFNMDAPEPHNLLGIYYEIIGNDGAARKHYRAAYALDPTYKPACRNLERLVDFEPSERKFDYGVTLTAKRGSSPAPEKINTHVGRLQCQTAQYSGNKE